VLLFHATVAAKQIADKIDPLKPRILTRSAAPNCNPFSTSQIDIVPDHLTVLCISTHVLELEDKIDLVLYLAAALQGVGAQVGCTRSSWPTCYEVHVFSAHVSVILTLGVFYRLSTYKTPGIFVVLALYVKEHFDTTCITKCLFSELKSEKQGGGSEAGVCACQGV